MRHMAGNISRITVAFGLLLTLAQQPAEAYYGVTDLSYTGLDGEGGGDTLSGFAATYRQPWDTVSNRWYDYGCECYIYFESSMGVVLNLYRPDGSHFGQAGQFDMFDASFGFSGLPANPAGDWVMYSDHNVVGRTYDPGGYYCGGYLPCELIESYWWSTNDQVRTRRCGDQRDDIIAQYPARQVPWTPQCEDFTNGVPVQSYYTWEDWRSHEYPWEWAILRDYMVANNTCIIDNTSPYFPNTFSSGYRTPNKNAGTSGAAGNSRHMHGDAADIYEYSQEGWDYLRYVAKDSGACGFACVEPRSMTPVWFHHDYRGGCPAAW